MKRSRVDVTGIKTDLSFIHHHTQPLARIGMSDGVIPDDKRFFAPFVILVPDCVCLIGFVIPDQQAPSTRTDPRCLLFGRHRLPSDGGESLINALACGFPGVRFELSKVPFLPRLEDPEPRDIGERLEESAPEIEKVLLPDFAGALPHVEVECV